MTNVSIKYIVLYNRELTPCVLNVHCIYFTRGCIIYFSYDPRCFMVTVVIFSAVHSLCSFIGWKHENVTFFFWPIRVKAAEERSYNVTSDSNNSARLQIWIKICSIFYILVLKLVLRWLWDKITSMVFLCDSIPLNRTQRVAFMVRRYRYR